MHKSEAINKASLLKSDDNIASEIIEKANRYKREAELIKIDAKTNEAVGKHVIALIACNLHKAAEDVYEFISMYKEISVEQAKKENVLAILKEVVKNPGVKDFLA